MNNTELQSIEHRELKSFSKRTQEKESIKLLCKCHRSMGLLFINKYFLTIWIYKSVYKAHFW